MYEHMQVELECATFDKVETETAVTTHRGHQLVYSAKNMGDAIVQECLLHVVSSLKKMAPRDFVVNNISPDSRTIDDMCTH